MPKHARKRQRTAAADEAPVPLGAISLTDEASKDDEERRLESMLFGTAYVPTDAVEEDELEQGPGKELENLLDADLFYIDGGGQGQPSPAASASSSRSSSPAPLPSAATLPPTRKPPAWTDPADADVEVPLAAPRLRKLRDAPTETALPGREYEARLRRQFERIHPAPAWARKRPRTSATADEEEEDADPDALLSSTGGILASKKPVGAALSAGTLAIERVRDANQAAHAAGAGEVRALAFHPSPSVPVLAVASADRRLRFFNIDGHTNPALHTLHVPALPLARTTFHPDGTSLLLGGPCPFFYTHDLQSGATRRSRTLLDDASAGGWGNGSASGGDTTIHAFSPAGELLAIAGRGGAVHLLDWRGGGGAVGSVRGGSAGVRVLHWTAGPRPLLVGLGGDAEVFLWDVGERRCVRRWRDAGGFRGAGGAMGAWTGGLAIGSNTGLVNVYGADALAAEGSTPAPRKTLSHLRTAVTSVAATWDAQVLGVASRTTPDAVRLIHVPTLTAFANWPAGRTPLGRVSALAFAARGEYLAAGNTRGRVLLYHLKAYGAGA